MSKKTIQQMLEAHGTFPDKAQVLAGFDALFRLAEAGQETVEDLAGGFMLALDQWSHEDAIVEPALAARLRGWALSQWPADAGEARIEALCGVLVNVPAPEVLARLQAARREATDPQLQQLLDGYLEDLSDEP